MSLLLLEGFEDGHAIAKTFESGYMDPNFMTTDPRTGTYACNRAVDFKLDSAWRHARMITGFGHKYASTATNLILIDGRSEHNTISDNYTQQWRLDVTSTGKLRAYRGNGATLLGESDDGVMAPVENTWHYVEVDVLCDDTVGHFKVWVNGTQVIDLTNVDTRGASSSSYPAAIGYIKWLGDNSNQRVDDIILMNGAGTDYNARRGVIAVYHLYPNGNGNYSQLTGSDGNSVDNYQQVDDGDRATVVGTEADYNGDDVTAATKDTYSFDDLPAAVGSIHGVELRAYAAKNGVGAGGGRFVWRQGTTDAVSADRVLADTYVTARELAETDPTDASAWTIAKVNSIEAGWEVRP